MAHAFHQLYYHFAWATSCREPAIERAWRPQLLRILNDEAKKRGGWPIRHNAMPDHVHLLVRLPPNVTVSDFVGEVKGAASYRVNHELKPQRALYW
jgi:REP element-mobilizing transposase RayT